jgi:hypothetical protein
MIEEEGDVTEIYFIMDGDWAVAFDSFSKGDVSAANLDPDDLDMLGKPDMSKRGILIANQKSGFGYIGDYYVLASKRSQFYYVALTRV